LCTDFREPVRFRGRWRAKTTARVADISYVTTEITPAKGCQRREVPQTWSFAQEKARIFAMETGVITKLKSSFNFD